jgi:hypothetical protein
VSEERNLEGLRYCKLFLNADLEHSGPVKKGPELNSDLFESRYKRKPWAHGVLGDKPFCVFGKKLLRQDNLTLISEMSNAQCIFVLRVSGRCKAKHEGNGWGK